VDIDKVIQTIQDFKDIGWELDGVEIFYHDLAENSRLKNDPDFEYAVVNVGIRIPRRPEQSS